jgi:hypothetical protein
LFPTPKRSRVLRPGTREEFGGGGLAALFQRGDRGRGNALQPATPVPGDPLVLEHRHQPVALRRSQPPGAGGIDHPTQRRRHHEQGAPHPEEADQAAVVVERLLEVFHHQTIHPGAPGQVGNGRIAGVKADQIPGGHLDAVGAAADR